MTRVVQAECPHCKKVLRIPADWLAQPMKCKQCQQVFQARVKAPQPSAISIPLKPPLAPAVDPFFTSSLNPHSSPPFGPHSSPPLEGGAGGGGPDIAANTPLPPYAIVQISELAGETGFTPPRSSRRRQRRWWKGALLFGFMLVCAGVLLVFAGPRLTELFTTKETQETGQNKVMIIDPSKKNTSPVIGKKDSSLAKADPRLIPIGGDLFPRRALLINVSNYLLFNPLHYGNPRDNSFSKYPGSSTAVLADTMNRPPLNMPATQITELADASRSPFSTAKPIIENTLSEFVDTARAQDRVIVLFTGHAIDIDKEAYLVPVEGDRQDAKTLIPLAWVYDKLAKCKARQKVLILDVFRYPPARGEELPGTGEMTDDFDAKLLTPPPGVQVWASCIKGQQSIELEGGSVFMQALCAVLQERLPGIQEPGAPLPLQVIVPKVNQRLKEILAPQKLEQVSRLSGTHAEDSGIVYHPDEPLPPKLVLKPASRAVGENAGLAAVKTIVDELNQLPPVRAHQKATQATSLPAFSAKALEEYKADYKTWSELVEMAKDANKYPLRAAVLEAIRVLKDSEKIVLRESLTNPGGPITPQVKSLFAATQQEPGMMIFEMEKALAQIKEAGAKRDEEKSKRWLANYDYALARLQERLVYIYEYDYILAQVRSDSLPPLEPVHNGWRVGSQKKVQINEPKVKDMVKRIGRTWKRIAEENPGTPWAVLAKRESMTALGLVWRASRD